MNKRICAVGFSAMLAAATYSEGALSTQDTHFDPNGTMPSKYTIELRKGISATLPFEDKRDFDEAKKGFIAEPDYKQIMADAGNVAVIVEVVGMDGIEKPIRLESVNGPEVTVIEGAPAPTGDQRGNGDGAVRSGLDPRSRSPGLAQPRSAGQPGPGKRTPLPHGLLGPGK